MQEAAGGSTGDDRATAPGHVHGGTERLLARVLEHDVDVLTAGQLPDPFTETPPFLGVLPRLVDPELVAVDAPVDDRLGSHVPADARLGGVGHHAHRVGTAVER